MSTLTLLQKASSEAQTRTITDILGSLLKDLRVEIQPCRLGMRGWIQTTLSGEDKEIALNYLAREIGVCPTDSSFIGKFSTLKGYIISLDKHTSSAIVDVGILSPDDVYVKIPLHNIQAQLVDGRKLALPKIAELFGLCEKQPVTVKILSGEKQNGYFEARFAESQLIQYTRWVRSLLDRLLILGASCNAVQQAVKKAKCVRDVVGIESLGLLEQILVCKLGTNAVGLIPIIGRFMPSVSLDVFSPTKIVRFFEDPPFLSSL